MRERRQKSKRGFRVCQLFRAWSKRIANFADVTGSSVTEDFTIPVLRVSPETGKDVVIKPVSLPPLFTDTVMYPKTKIEKNTEQNITKTKLS